MILYRTTQGCVKKQLHRLRPARPGPWPRRAAAARGRAPGPPPAAAPAAPARAGSCREKDVRWPVNSCGKTAVKGWSWSNFSLVQRRHRRCHRPRRLQPALQRRRRRRQPRGRAARLERERMVPGQVGPIDASWPMHTHENTSMKGWSWPNFWADTASLSPGRPARAPRPGPRARAPRAPPGHRSPARSVSSNNVLYFLISIENHHGNIDIASSKPPAFNARQPNRV